MRVGLFLGVVLPIAAGCTSSPSRWPPGIAHFRAVTGDLYCGARPDDSGIAFLNRIGVRTIVDLEIANRITGNRVDIEHESAEAKKYGMTFVNMPMSAFTTVDDGQVTQILAILRDRAARPTFIHCRFGEDRTALVIGLERVIDEGWSPQDAHDEMVKSGFHWEFIALNHYFEEKTGWED